MKTHSLTPSRPVWQVSDISNAEYLGMLEIRPNEADVFDFQVLLIPGKRYVFGGTCNAGFLESGYMLLEDSGGGNWRALYDDLETYYRDGPSYVSRIVCNDRM